MINPTYEELELQVAVLRELLEEVFIGFVDYVEGGEEDEVMAAIKQAIADTSETAKWHDARVKAEALRKFADKIRSANAHNSPRLIAFELSLREEADELEGKK